MKTIELHLDDATYARVQQLADFRAQTVPAAVEGLVARSPELAPVEASTVKTARSAEDLIGSWADDADMVEEMIEEIMRDRERRNDSLLRGG